MDPIGKLVINFSKDDLEMTVPSIHQFSIEIGRADPIWWIHVATKFKKCLVILLMEEILHLLINTLSYYLQGFSTIPGGGGFLSTTWNWYLHLHPWNLTVNRWKMVVGIFTFLLGRELFRGHVKLLAASLWDIPSLPKKQQPLAISNMSDFASTISGKHTWSFGKHLKNGCLL